MKDKKNDKGEEKNRSGGVTRTELEREKDLVLVGKLNERGVTLRGIAKIISNRRPYTLSHVTIKNDLDEIKKRYREEQKESVENYVNDSLRQLDAIKRETWKAILRDTKRTVKRKQKKTGTIVPGSEGLKVKIDGNEVTFHELTGEDGEVEQVIEIESKNINPQYLNILIKLEERRAKLLGLDKVPEINPEEANVLVILPPKVERPNASGFIPETE